MLTHDFPSLARGKAVPYGTYDVAEDQALVNVGITHDTAEFAVSSIQRWWRMMGKKELSPGETSTDLCRCGRQQ